MVTLGRSPALWASGTLSEPYGRCPDGRHEPSGLLPCDSGSRTAHCPQLLPGACARVGWGVTDQPAKVSSLPASLCAQQISNFGVTSGWDLPLPFLLI